MSRVITYKKKLKPKTERKNYQNEKLRKNSNTAEHQWQSDKNQSTRTKQINKHRYKSRGKEREETIILNNRE